MSTEFELIVSLYKAGLYDKICWHDASIGKTVWLHEKQLRFIEYWNDDITTYCGYGGAARGGKSLLIAFIAIVESYAYPATCRLIGRKNLTTLYSTTWKTLLRLLHTWGFEEKVHYKHNGQRHELVFENGSSIIARNLELKPSDDEASDFGSLEILNALLDQTESVNLKIITKVGERVGSHGAVKYNLKGKVMEAFNPARTHVHRRYWQPFRNKNEKETVRFVQALPSDNPGEEARRWVEEKTKDFKDGTMVYSEYQKQILGNFDFDDSPDNLVSYDEICDLYTNDHVLSGAPYLTADIAGFGSDKFRCVVWSGLRATHYYTLNESDAYDIVTQVKTICRKHSIPMRNVVFDADGMGNIIKGKPLKGAQEFQATRAALRKEGEKDKKNYENLKTQCAFVLADKISSSELYIDDRELSESQVEEINDELSQLKRRSMDSDGKLKIIKKEDMKQNIGRSPDWLDNFIMRMMFEVSLKKRKRLSSR